MARVRAKSASSEPLAPQGDLVPVVREPELLLPELQNRTDKLRLGMSMDLGLRTGITATLFDPSKPFDLTRQAFYQAQIDLRLNDYDTRAVHGMVIRSFLNRMQPDVLFVEDVKFTANSSFESAAAACARIYGPAEMFGGMKALISDWALANGVPLKFIGIGTIKQRATGSGRANKLDVLQAHNRVFGTNFSPADMERHGLDNVADSGFILLCGLEEYCHGVDSHAADPTRSRRHEAGG